MSKEYLNHNINQKETSSANHNNHNIKISLSLPLKRHKGAAFEKARVIVFWLTAVYDIWEKIQWVIVFELIGWRRLPLSDSSTEAYRVAYCWTATALASSGKEGEIYPININSIDLTIPLQYQWWTAYSSRLYRYQPNCINIKLKCLTS